MYTITLRPSGYILKFSGNIQLDEMQNWYNDSIKYLEDAPESFGVIVDMTRLQPLTPEVQRLMVDGQELYRNAGMQRSSVILQNPIIKLQFNRLAKESGIIIIERYFDGSTPGAIDRAIEWVKNGVYIDHHEEVSL